MASFFASSSQDGRVGVTCVRPFLSRVLQLRMMDLIGTRRVFFVAVPGSIVFGRNGDSVSRDHLYGFVVLFDNNPLGGAINTQYYERVLRYWVKFTSCLFFNCKFGAK